MDCMPVNAWEPSIQEEINICHSVGHNKQAGRHLDNDLPASLVRSSCQAAVLALTQHGASGCCKDARLSLCIQLPSILQTRDARNESRLASFEHQQPGSMSEHCDCTCQLAARTSNSKFMWNALPRSELEINASSFSIVVTLLGGGVAWGLAPAEESENPAILSDFQMSSWELPVQMLRFCWIWQMRWTRSMEQWKTPTAQK